MQEFKPERVYGPELQIIPSKKSLRRCLKGVRLRARNDFKEDNRLRARIIKEEIEKLLKELY